MKKVFSLFFVLIFLGVLVFGLFGCGTDTAVETPEEEVEVVEEVAEEQEVTLDQGEVLLAAAEAYFPKTAESNNIMSADDLKAMLDDNPNSVLVLDIRSAEDFEAGHIEGAVHSPWAKVGEIMDRIPRNRPVIVACYSGQTAGQTVGVLRMAGFDNVKSLASGMTFGWGAEGAGYPTDGTGMVAAADLSSVSSPANEEEAILWEVAMDYFDAVASSNNIIPGPELHEALEANPNAFYVLDIRSKEDYDQGHIVGSVHSPWSEVGNLLGDLPSTRPIIVACYSGQTAGQTVGVLRMLGYDARSLQFGIREGWVKRENLPLVTE
jgi:rhodanese-related sulfurtransferase